ncbi:MAG: glycoside hydrolase family 88 protein [Bacteroidales bacterium]
MKKFWLGLSASVILLSSCSTSAKQVDFIQDNIDNAVAQNNLQVEIIENSGKILNPRTIEKDGSTQYVPIEDWTSGFFPGSMWYMYELTDDNKWEGLAKKYTEDLDSVKNLKWHHDVGFMVYCSFGNGYRLTGSPEYKEVIIEAAKSLSTRFRPGAKVIQSWDADRGWQGKRGWKCPVIIDNMMNLELLFEATKLSGDSTFWNIAVDHANTTMAHHYRPDNSCYHVIDYDPETGEVRHKQTAQGAGHESAWSRGQAWGLYGYTVCYRYTRDPKYLEMAEKIYDYMFNNPNMPEDLVPYWDYNYADYPEYIEKFGTPRDASAASVSASALYEMSTYGKPQYKEVADKIMTNLGSPAYRAEVGTNNNFILMHSTGSIPHGQEVDVPLNYADYYFLEALVRKGNLENN